jgi:CubicO group peptidase (beta-lactamase class C family)
MMVATAAASLCAMRASAQAASALAPAPPEVCALIEAERNVVLQAMARERIEGVAVSLVYDGAPIWVEGFGVTDARTGRRVSTDTIFSIQSTSKNIAATAVMIAVQRGILDLDEPIGVYLPDFTVLSRFEPAPQEKITLRLLLSHRAGFTHEAPVGNNYDPSFPNFEAHVRSISATWLRYPVGERYRYANLGYDLAGWILQVRCGTPFADWVRTVLFEPLGMNDSTVATDMYVNRKNRAVGHDAGHATVPLKTPLIPSGGVYTSARDMALYAKFQLARGTADGKVLLKEALWNEMHGFALGGDYGLGVIREELRYGDTPLRLFSHKGGGFGFGSVFEYCPEAGLAWTALFNRPVDAAYRFGAGLVNGVLTRRLGERRPRLAARDLAPIEPDRQQLQPYVGSYVGRNILGRIELKDGGLGLREGPVLTAMRFNAPDEPFKVGPHGDVVSYRYSPPKPAEPAHLECWVGEDSLDYNDGPDDVAGPDSPSWAPYLGEYRIYQWGVPADEVSIRRRNGYLYLNQIKLVVEPEPGLFFTADGEAVDFRSHEPTWKNIRLQRVD